MAHDPRTPDAITVRRRLARMLRLARNTTQERVTAAMYWHPSKIMRIEAATVGVSPNDLKALLKLYGVEDAQTVEEYVELAMLAKRKSPLDKYSKFISPQFRTYLGFEESARVIRNFECTLLPGLLQTEDYAHSVLTEIRVIHTQERIEQLVKLRLERQRDLLANPEVMLHFMIDQSVLVRAPGTNESMAAQLQHLLDVADQPNIDLRVVPFSAGVYRNVRIPYVVLEFPEPEDPPALFLEYADGDVFLQGDEVQSTQIKQEGSEEISAPLFLEGYFEVEQLTTPAGSLGLIHNALKNLSSG